MFCKKGKRQIVVNGETYYWHVTKEPDMEIDLIIHIASESRYLFQHYFPYLNKQWKPLQDSTRVLALGTAPEITPGFVRTLILQYLAAD